MNWTGTQSEIASNILRVAIVGAGPAGFHAAISLLEQSACEVEVDLFDRLPTPYGLVRAGVAPDHQKIKGITRIYDKLGTDPRFAFYGHVELGRDIQVSDLTACYDQVLYATGNESDRRLGIPGEHLVGCAPASVFVGWYNGHPDYRDAKFDLSGHRVAVIGNGNVAIDVARMLAKSPADLETTDMAEHALTELRRSEVDEIVLIGRRGPLQSTFTPAELRELIALPNVDATALLEEVKLDEQTLLTLEELGAKHPSKRIIELLTTIAERQQVPASRAVKFRFLRSPVEFIGDAAGHVRQMRLQRNRLVVGNRGTPEAVGTGEFELMAVGAVFVAIGYEGKRIAGLPFDEARGVIANVDGRVVDPETQQWRQREYCTGWARTGAKGLIASQKVGSAEVVSRMLGDHAQSGMPSKPRCGRNEFRARLEQRQVRWVTFDDWQVIDAFEVDRGLARGALRSKIVEIPEMIDLVEMQRRGW